MMLEIMAYTVAVTAALTVAGMCLEHLAGLLHRPRRKVWMAAMVLSIALPVAMLLGTRASAIPDAAIAEPTPVSVHVNPVVAPAQAFNIAASQAGPIWKLAAPSDAQLMTMWITASTLFGLYLAGANFLLRRRATRWQRATVQGSGVLVSEVTGPALLGVLLPQIVVPRWLLQQSATVQQLILEHERQHMQARDPLLAVAGLFIIATVPWNLPLWWQWRRMRQAVEMDCDARVLRTGAAAETYAEVLLAVTKRVTRMPPGTLAMIEPLASLERRIDCLVPAVVRYAKLQTVVVLGLATLITGAALALDAPRLPIHAAGSAANANVITAPTAAAITTQAMTPVASEVATAPSETPRVGNRASTKVTSKENSVNKTRSIAAAVAAVGAAAATQVQSAEITTSSPPDPSGRAKAEQIIAANDLNKDGIVTQAEAAKVNGNLHIMWTVVYDMDHDGKVDVAEVMRANADVALGTALEKITGSADGHLHGAKPEMVIANNDQNGDGIVTKEEAATAGKALIRMWDSYDLNKDGKVDVAEVAKAEGY